MTTSSCLTAVGLNDEVLSHRLEQVWVVRDCPVDAPEGFLGGETAHEASDRASKLLVEAGDGVMNPLHVHPNLLADGPALWEAHNTGDEAQLAIDFSHEAEILLQNAPKADAGMSDPDDSASQPLS